MHLFVNFSRVNACPFSLRLGIRGNLRLVIVVVPGLFYQFVLLDNQILDEKVNSILLMLASFLISNGMKYMKGQ